MALRLIHFQRSGEEITKSNWWKPGPMSLKLCELSLASFLLEKYFIESRQELNVNVVLIIKNAPVVIRMLQFVLVNYFVSFLGRRIFKSRRHHQYQIHSTRRRNCVGCYQKLRATLNRLDANNKVKKIRSYCVQCKKGFCFECFCATHNPYWMINQFDYENVWLPCQMMG